MYCLTRLFDSNNHHKELLCIFRQKDGHPISHGADLIEIFKNKRLVNGDPRDENYFTNVGEVAVHLVSALSARAKILIWPVGDRMWSGAYEYHVIVPNKGPVNMPLDVPIVLKAFAVRMVPELVECRSVDSDVSIHEESVSIFDAESLPGPEAK